MTTSPKYRLVIYASDARTQVRTSLHGTWQQARRSLYDYERRHGRHPHAIDSECSICGSALDEMARCPLGEDWRHS